MTAPGALGRRRRRGGVFRVAQLFANGEAGGVYDPSDLTPEKVAWRRNLLTWSEDFTNAAWVKTNITVSANATTAPDGTLTADLLTETTAVNSNFFFTQQANLTAGIAHTFSVSCKPNGRSRIYLAGSSSAWGAGFITFNLLTGVVTPSGGSGWSGTITTETNGWYRITATRIVSASGGFNLTTFFLNDAGSVTYTGDGVSGAYFWGAQLEQSPAATAYQRITDFTSDFLAAFPTHTLFQDSAGTTPVTGLGQPVGRVLDTSGRGNHAIQPTSASRPLLDARVNLLTFSEQFDNAAWTKTNATVTANATTAPDGTTTADALFETTTNGAHAATASITLSAARHIVSFRIKANGRTRVAIAGGSSFGGNLGSGIFFDLSTGQYISGAASGAVPSITSLGNDWYLVSYEWTALAASSVIGVYLVDTGTNTSYAGDITKGVFLWGADLRLATDAAYPYQRVAAATDYADVGAPRSFLFDGVDDSLYTASNMDLSGTDKVTVLAGVRKLSDAATGMMVETSAGATSNNGAFLITVPDTTVNRYGMAMRGTSPVTLSTTNSIYTAPVTNVLTGIGDIAAPVTTLRANGAVAATSASSLGTGNFGSYVLNIGRRNNASFPLNGKLYQLIVRGAATDAGTLVQAERYVAQRTGITL